jgi:hypothetical protein
MKWIAIGVIAVLAVTMCTAQEPLDTGMNAGNDQVVTPPVVSEKICSLALDVISPKQNEIVSSGVQVEWTFVNNTVPEFKNKDIEFTIYLRSEAGASNDVRTITRMYGDVYKEDITFLQELDKGTYYVGLRGTGSGCVIGAVEVPVSVI